MGIYRGAGGSGDAVNDASSEALITIQARDAALAAQAAAEAAQAAAELAETNAETAETNAETAETNAETAATNAAASASAASTSASNAATSATNAANSATAAQTAETNAETAETNAAASASAASTSASNAATSATNASNSASAAATSATNASNSASAAATSATNAANSATAAQTAQTAAELAETNAETAEANAETAETNAAASASAAATSATNASNSASAASTSATNASNSASAAATSATNASNSASAAATSASNAAASESNAASSATAAAASYDSFDDRYLGAKSSAPTLDNDGNTLLVGALYFNTSTNEMKVWSGSTWLNAYASLSGALLATNNLSDLNNAATARDNLGVEIGVDVQAYDAQLADIAGLTPADNNFIVGNGTNFVTESGSTARTSLGLGTIATQDANNVAVTGGSINGTTVGASTPSTGSFTSLTDSGNLTFTGTGNRITGDFSNATIANRVAFQTSTTNGSTTVSVLPNGTGTATSVSVFNNSDPTNASFFGLISTSTEGRLNSSITGTGTYLPLTMYTGGSERLRIDTSGNVGIGTSSPATKLHVTSGAAAIGATFYSGNTSNYSRIAIGRTSAELNIGVSASTNQLVNGDVAGDATFVISNKSYLFSVDGGTTANLVLNSSGNVGIGTSSPSVRLHVAGEQLIQPTTVSNAKLSMRHGSLAANNYIETDSSANTIFGTNNAERMRITSGGNVGIGTSSPSYQLTVSQATTGYIFAVTDGTSTFGVANQGGSSLIGTITNHPLRFGTNDNERMRIDSSGNVGIGTSSPASQLEVKSAAFTDSIVTINSTSTNVSQRLNFTANGTLQTQIYDDSTVTRLNAVTSKPLAFSTNNTERMRITSGGAVGIGNSNPGALLHVTNNSNTYAGGILIGSAGVASGYISTTDNLYIKPNTTANTTSGIVVVQDFSNANKIILSSVNGTIGLGGANAASTGVGITFPATQSASSDANTLDDYEEGTFTPTIRGSGTAGTVTYAANGQIGRYTKIGNTVKFNIYLSWTNWTGSPSGGLWAAGLPFTSVASTNNFTAVNVYMDGAYTLSANNVIQGYINQNVNHVVISQYAVGGGNASDPSFDTNASLMISGVYETA